MKEVKMPIRHKGSGELVGHVKMMSNIDDVLFAIENEIDKKKIHEQFEDCACMHGDDCFDYMGTCVYCGFQLSEEQMKERRKKK